MTTPARSVVHASLAALLILVLASVSGAQQRHRTTPPSAPPTLLIEPDAGYAAIGSLIASATRTVDMTMYELVDPVVSTDLVASCQRGVKVRVILDQNLEKSRNQAAYTQLNAQPGCAAAWANPAFQATHQKSILVDGTTLALLTFNLTTIFYPTSRDFGLIDHNPADIAAVEATFNADYAPPPLSATNPPPAATSSGAPLPPRPPCFASSKAPRKHCSSKTRRWAPPTSSPRSRRAAAKASPSKSP